jgi:hypothetical protein
MDPEIQVDSDTENGFCPECGSDETGYFCRNCGALLRGEDMVLCPRCHQIVPDGEYCNQCGQGLGALALQLRQLALAGDTFWVTAPAGGSPAQPDTTLFEPDESVELAEAELPDWLQELPTESAPPDVESRIYPSLRPIRAEPVRHAQQGRFLTALVLLAGLVLLGLVILAFFLLLRGGV